MTSNMLRLGLLVLLCWAGTGCEDKGIGARCSLDIDGGTSSETTNINALAFECPSRICLSQASFAGATGFAGIAPLCTASCETSDDCSDAKTGDPQKDGLCPGGFVCAVSTTVGPFACKKLCICKQYFPIVDGQPVVTPPSKDVCK